MVGIKIMFNNSDDQAQDTKARRDGAEVAGWDFGSGDPGSIPRLPSPRVGPLMARR